jgi:GH15 family glucan-1,4-alpha-glucosidase
MAGEQRRATAVVRERRRLRNDLGLLAEQGTRSAVICSVNMPQAFSHVGLINAAWRLASPPAHASRVRDTG